MKVLEVWWAYAVICSLRLHMCFSVYFFGFNFYMEFIGSRHFAQRRKSGSFFYIKNIHLSILNKRELCFNLKNILNENIYKRNELKNTFLAFLAQWYLENKGSSEGYIHIVWRKCPRNVSKVAKIYKPLMANKL